VKLPIPFVANYLIGMQMRLIVWWLEQAPHYTPQRVAAKYYGMRLAFPPLCNCPESSASFGAPLHLSS
jgi:hypothetical protein